MDKMKEKTDVIVALMAKKSLRTMKHADVQGASNDLVKHVREHCRQNINRAEIVADPGKPLQMTFVD